MATQTETALDYCALVDDPIDLNDLAARVRTDAAGALAIFSGTVRNHHEGRQVDGLEYEAYGPMAESQMKAIASEIRSRWRLEGVAILHRTGHLEVGEISVAVAVSAAHRREALEACSHAIDRLKTSVPIWKREHGEAGAGWVIGAASPSAALAPSPPAGRASARRRTKADA